MRASSAKVLACGALALVLSGCGGYHPNMATIEADLTHQIEQKDDLTDLTVACPTSVDWKPGSAFHCTLDSIELVNPPRVTVSMEDDKGDYTWAVANLSGSGPS